MVFGLINMRRTLQEGHWQGQQGHEQNVQEAAVKIQSNIHKECSVLYMIQAMCREYQ